jgi:hypothetical protein
MWSHLALKRREMEAVVHTSASGGVHNSGLQYISALGTKEGVTHGGGAARRTHSRLLCTTNTSGTNK